jgi:hypothetical protein
MTAAGRHSSPLPVRLAAILLVGGFLLLVARFRDPVYGFTRFLQLDASNDAIKLEALRSHPVYVYRDTGGYDGLFYVQIAHDPSISDPQLRVAMTDLSYRARRILLPAAAWLLAAGQAGWIAPVYAALNPIVWLAFAWLLWRLLAVDRGGALLAWAGVLFSAGVLASVRFALTDLPALLLVALGLSAVERNRARYGSGWLAAAALSRETSLLALGGALSRPWFSRRNLGLALLAAGPLALWLVYLRWRLGPASAGWANFSAPLSGLIGKAGSAFTAVAHPGPGEALTAWASLAALLALAAQVLFLLRHRRREDVWWRAGLGYAILLLCLGPAVWAGFPGAATRVLLPLTLAFNVLAVRTRAGVVWLVVGNLTVLSGLLMLRDVHHDIHELATDRVRGVAIVARTNDGWYGVERSAHHTWAWSRGQGGLSFESWPRENRDLRVDFSLRSLRPVTVTVAQGGTVRWRGHVGPALSPATAVVAVGPGAPPLRLFTDDPPATEAPEAGARTLAFAIYDLRPSLPESRQ